MSGLYHKNYWNLLCFTVVHYTKFLICLSCSNLVPRVSFPLTSGRKTFPTAAQEEWSYGNEIGFALESFSSPEPTILLTCGRDRELWSAFLLTGKTGENFPSDGTVQFFQQKKWNGSSCTIWQCLLFFLGESKGVSKITTLKPQTNKGLITWRISARAELSARLAGLKFCCDYMKNFTPGWNVSLDAKYEIVCEKSQENQNTWRYVSSK